MEQFPAMYGSWICWPVMTMWEGAYTDCMRFLPKDSYSSPEDYAFRQGPIQVMTYLTSRTEDGTSPIANNERLTSEDISTVFETFTVDLMGAWSGISKAGLALATACALWTFWAEVSKAEKIQDFYLVTISFKKHTYLLLSLFIWTTYANSFQSPLYS